MLAARRPHFARGHLTRLMVAMSPAAARSLRHGDWTRMFNAADSGGDQGRGADERDDRQERWKRSRKSARS